MHKYRPYLREGAPCWQAVPHLYGSSDPSCRARTLAPPKMMSDVLNVQDQGSIVKYT